MEISALTLSEIDSATALWTSAGLTRPWNDPQADIKFALATPSSTVLAGRLDGAVIATVMVGFDGHRGWVYYLAVEDAHRGRGFGAAMMQAAENWLVKHGVPKLLLMIRPENDTVLKFYEAIGYSLNEVIVMQKKLGDSAN
ncbi:GNAT family acetyltransferase [Spirosoma pollinicola]|uniref:GNAT family acetyltransferase n=1 Tax=Spirosoma pollinicola TaxID=2057025 RepID=A0A2K8YWZ8_9BACT|nr:GNAT family acetyltransferase [Spirosoma pollinicola]AUD02151.1 GNAT family acetyltransferase [Spirosoma pollinicola]